jgi:hypothetical protein
MTYFRTWGRTYDLLGNPTWQLVQTDANGLNDNVYITALAQVLKLNLGESPFYADYGIPAHQSVVTQIAPDFYMTRTQQQFAKFFASLTITKLAPTPPISGRAAPSPTYQIRAVTHTGVILPPVTIPTQIPV